MEPAAVDLDSTQCFGEPVEESPIDVAALAEDLETRRAGCP
jgi:hypothetical protein